MLNDEDVATKQQISNLMKSNGFNGELIKHRVPMHCGGLSDPFQPREFKDRLTLYLLWVTMDYPIMFSTKTDYLPDEYYEILDPKYHVFQLSIAGIPQEHIRNFEANTPTTANRLDFAKLLKSKGFTVFVRIQPLIKYDWAEYLITELGDIVDGFTIEHLKMPLDNKERFDYLTNKLASVNAEYKLKATGREYEISADIKHDNISKLKQIKRNAKILVGDNDLRLMSEAVNCCGLDLCPSSFDNWIRYNSMAIKITGNRDVWYPKGNCNEGINGDCQIPGYDLKDYVEKYYRENYEPNEQMALF